MNAKIFPSSFFILMLLVVFPCLQDQRVSAITLTSCSPSACTAACNSSCTWYSCDRVNPGDSISTIPVTFSHPTETRPICDNPHQSFSVTTLPFTDHGGVTQHTLPITVDDSYDICTTHVTTRGYDGTWNTGGWSACSAACGPGTQTRSVTCSNGCCNPATQPASSQSCNNGACGCGNPPAIPNRSIGGGGSNVGDTRSLSCVAGMGNMSGTTYITCLASLSWENKGSTCYCLAESAGGYSWPQTTEGQHAVLPHVPPCPVGVGSKTRYCNASSGWQAPQDACP